MSSAQLVFTSGRANVTLLLMRSERFCAGWFVLFASLVAACSPADVTDDAGDDSSLIDASADDAPDASNDSTIDTSEETTSSDGTLDTSDETTSSDVSTDVVSTDVTADSEGGGADGGALICPVACPAGTKFCNSICVSIDDPRYGCTPVGCGACIGGLKNVASLTCSAGVCAIGRCATGFADCDGVKSNGCESNLGSAATCGSCTHACGTSQVCDGTTCASTCTFPKTNCSGSCRDLSSDPAACGACNTPCSESNDTATCSNGTCSYTCDTGYTKCGNGVCNDTTAPAYDKMNLCGSCTTTCPAPTYGTTEACLNSQCVSACAQGFSACNSQCVDESSDASNCGKCGNACVNGQICVGGGCVALSTIQVVTSLSAPEDVAVDANNIYWTDTGTNEVWQANKSTFAATKLASNQAKPYRLAVDAQYVYWTSLLGGAILRAPIGGGAVNVMYSANSPKAIAVDASYVYWSDTGTDVIYKAPKDADAGAPTVLYNCNYGYACQTDDFKIDASQLYFAYSFVGIFGLDKTSGVLTDYLGNMFVNALAGVAVDSTNIYFTWSQWQQLQLVYEPLDKSVQNGEGPYLPSGESYPPTDMVADGCSVYWVDGSANVWKLPTAMAYATWASSNANVITSPTKVTGSATSAHRLAVDDSYVYWTDSGWIGRVAK